ncbi:MAG: ROK family protein, partial [Sphaerochaetaceae bacterium]
MGGRKQELTMREKPGHYLLMSPNDTPKMQEPHTTVELRLFNLQHVYSYIYQAQEASRLEVSHETKLSIPTVTTNISELERLGLVVKVGEQKSTGGRRAQIFKCNNLARVAIGVEILKGGIQLVAIDLYGAILKECHDETPFENTDSYYQHLGGFINTFAKSLEIERDHILGVGIALQGLISPDGSIVTYSEILRCTGTERKRFQEYIDYPCTLVHDTDAAALAEIWHVADINSAVYLALNRNFGGTLIINGQVGKNLELSNSVIEHMCLDPSGPLCYCGRHGCVETFCSANHLSEMAGMDIPQFFISLHQGDSHCKQVWSTYTSYLARAMENVRMTLNCDFILGGYLMQFTQESDFDGLAEAIDAQCSLLHSSCTIRFSRFAEKSPKLGAAISFVDAFL